MHSKKTSLFGTDFDYFNRFRPLFQAIIGFCDNFPVILEFFYIFGIIKFITKSF